MTKMSYFVGPREVEEKAARTKAFIAHLNIEGRTITGIVFDEKGVTLCLDGDHPGLLFSGTTVFISRVGEEPQHTRLIGYVT